MKKIANLKNVGSIGGGYAGLRIGIEVAQTILFNAGIYTVPLGIVCEVLGGTLGGGAGAVVGGFVGNAADKLIDRKDVANE